MDPRNRVILPLRFADQEASRAATDVSGLLLHLLLFDTVIVPSIRLLDIADAARTIGLGQMMDLLDNGALKIRAEVDHIGSFNNLGNEIQMARFTGSDPNTILSTYMQSLKGTGRKADVHRLKRAIVRGWIRPTPPADDRYAEQAIDIAIREAVMISPVFLAAVQARLRREGIERTISRDMFMVESIDASHARFTTKELGSKDDGLVVKSACAAIAELEAHYGRMCRDNAVSAISNDSQEILQAKLGQLSHLWSDGMDPAIRTEEFTRVISAAGLPDFGPAVAEGIIDVDRLLKVRETDECRLFRNFLNTSSDLDDKALREATASLRAKVGDSLKTGTGKALRWLASTGAGLIPVAGPILGAAVGAADTFLIEKLFPTKGVMTFLGKQYPSLFRPEYGD
jgi:hypothetical protein